jgi:hypothetical protein
LRQIPTFPQVFNKLFSPISIIIFIFYGRFYKLFCWASNYNFFIFFINSIPISRSSPTKSY